MSGVLQPVGPEPASTYWLRRALVIGVLVVVVSVLVVSTTGGRQPPVAASAAPASATHTSVTPALVNPAPVNPAPVTPAPVPPRPGDVSPSPSAAATHPAARPSLSPSPTTVRPRDRQTVPAKPPSTSVSPHQASDLCDPAALRPTLVGQPQVRAKQDSTFTASLTNRSDKACSISVDAENFELKIASGKDQIWSSGDCSTAVKSIVRTVPSQQAVEWRMSWNGRRSMPGCKNGADTLKAGTYLATAQLEGAQAVSFRMTLG